MLRGLERARPWNCSDYVCLACRHKLRAVQNQPRRQKSTQTPYQAAAQFPADSWEENFNNLDSGLELPKAAGRVPKDALSLQLRRIEGKNGVPRGLGRRGRVVSRGSEETTRMNRAAKSGASKTVGRSTDGRRKKDSSSQATSHDFYGNDGPQCEDRNTSPMTMEDVGKGKYPELEELLANIKQEVSSEVAHAESKPSLLPFYRQVWTKSSSGEHSRSSDSLNMSDGTNKKSQAYKAYLHAKKVDDQQTSAGAIQSLLAKLLAEPTTSKQGLSSDVARTVHTAEDGSLGISIRDGASSFVSSSGETTTEQHKAHSPSIDSEISQGTASGSAARRTLSTWLMNKLLVTPQASEETRHKATKEDDATKLERAETEILPFGAQTSDPRSAVVRDPGSVTLTVPRPTFKTDRGGNNATTTLAKLHNGWNLADVNVESLKPAAGKGEKKPTKRPVTPRTPGSKEKPSNVSKKSSRRERLKQRSKGQASAKKGKGMAKSKGQASAKKEKGMAKSKGGIRIRRVDSKQRPLAKTSESKSPTKEDASMQISPYKPPRVLAVTPNELAITPLDIPQPAVPSLEYGLDRVLFNSGVYSLQDPHSRVYNFDPYLQMIMPVVEFDFNALKEYKTSSQDVTLADLARSNGKRYIGSTSSMTGTLGHFHYLLSAFRPINTDMLSRGFPEKLDTFTAINRAPNAIFLRWKNGTYAVDADKEYDSANVLMMLGKSMEKLLTLPTADYERYRKSDPRSVSDEERTAPEAFQYTTMGDFLMRSQLDAYDPRLPGTGMFDLKTRAVLTVRMNTDDFQPMTGYEIQTLHGRFESYEREYYDMLRSTMLKYMLQVRMGRMDGIFIAYHNVERIFGFQYVSLQEMDQALHGQGDTCLGDQEFKMSLEMLNKVFDLATAKYPEQSLRFHFEAQQESLSSETTVLWVYAEPMAEDQIDNIQSSSKARIAEFEREMMGMEKEEQPDTENTSSEATKLTDAPATSAREFPSNADLTTTDKGDESGDMAPLFVANILLQSNVNGKAVTRPESLRSSDTWTVDYIIQEWEADKAMWARYEQMKARRKQKFEKFNDGDEDESNEPKDKESMAKQKKEKGFTEFLKRMSLKGRAFRAEADRLEAGQTPVVLGQPLNSVAETGGEAVEGVEDYMSWLYGKRSTAV